MATGMVGSSNLLYGVNPSNTEIGNNLGTIQQGAINLNYAGALGAVASNNSLWATGFAPSMLMDGLFLNNFLQDGKYFLQTFGYLMERLGNKKMFYDVPSVVFGHTEQDKPYAGATMRINGIRQAANLQCVISTTNTRIYFRKGDTLINNATSLGVNYLIVDEPVLSGGFESFTVVKMDGSTFGAAEVLANQKYGDGGSRYAEAQGVQNGRITIPSTKTNKLNLIKTGIQISGDAAASDSIIDFQGFGSGASPFMRLAEFNMIQDHMRQIEAAYMFGSETPNAGLAQPAVTGTIQAEVPVAGRGIWNDIYTTSGNVKAGYGASLSEAELISFANSLRTVSSNQSWLGFTGGTLMGDVQSALQSYTLAGATIYGNFSSDPKIYQAAGINFDSYTVGGVGLKFIHYRGFDDTDICGNASAGASSVDFSKQAMFIADKFAVGQIQSNGVNQSVPTFYFTYRKMGGLNRNLVVGRLNGLTGASINAGTSNSVLDATVNTMSAQPLQTDNDFDRLLALSQVGCHIVGTRINTAILRADA